MTTNQIEMKLRGVMDERYPYLMRCAKFNERAVAERTGTKEVMVYFGDVKIAIPMNDVEDLIQDLQDSLAKDECPDCGGTGIAEAGCSNCGGSGEGMHDGSSCSVCHGRGVVGVQCDCGTEPDDQEPPEKEYDDDHN